MLHFILCRMCICHMFNKVLTYLLTYLLKETCQATDASNSAVMNTTETWYTREICLPNSYACCCSSSEWRASISADLQLLEMRLPDVRKVCRSQSDMLTPSGGTTALPWQSRNAVNSPRIMSPIAEQTTSTTCPVLSTSVTMRYKCLLNNQWLKCKIRGGGTLHSGLGPWQGSCAFP